MGKGGKNGDLCPSAPIDPPRPLAVSSSIETGGEREAPFQSKLVEESLASIPPPRMKTNAAASGTSGVQHVPSVIKLLLLVVLCLQNAVYSMLRRYSVGVLEETWSTSSVLMMGEVIKLVFSTAVTLADTSASSAEGTGVTKLFWLFKASPPMAVPAVVFWLMNLLSYVSLKRVDASTFTVCAQMKILTTAVFSVLLMGRRFHPRKWRALFLLVLGVTLVSNGSYAPDDEDNTKEFNMQYVIGVAAVLTEVTLSGFVSVFFEKVLKSRVVNLSVWDRNFQLAVYSIALYLPLALLEEGSLFEGWTLNAIILAVLGSSGGLLVALTMKYTDAVMKTFATSGAIIVTAGAGPLLLGAPLDIPIGVGAGCTILSLLNYSDDGGGLAEDSKDSAARSHGRLAATASSLPLAIGRLAHDEKAATPSNGEYAGEDETSQSLLTGAGSARDSAA